MNLFNIERAFRQQKERKWEYLFWAIDIHDVLFRGQYASDQNYQPYGGCVDVLKWISNRKDQKIIIWTSSYCKHFEDVKTYFLNEHGICLDFHNSNPLCGNTEYADFTTKFYFNILLDDKSLGSFEYNWYIVASELERVTGESIIQWNDESKYMLNTGINKIINDLNRLKL